MLAREEHMCYYKTEQTFVFAGAGTGGAKPFVQRKDLRDEYQIGMFRK